MRASTWRFAGLAARSFWFASSGILVSRRGTAYRLSGLEIASVVVLPLEHRP
jgi:hypothetical protein